LVSHLNTHRKPINPDFHPSANVFGLLRHHFNGDFGGGEIGNLSRTYLTMEVGGKEGAAAEGVLKGGDLGGEVGQVGAE
jgi:hypothetical protein